jgi:hypothetical protein
MGELGSRTGLPHSGVRGFLERLGGSVVAPRWTFEALLRGAPGGVRDLVWLLLLQVVAVHLPQLVAAVLVMLRQSYSSGMTLLLNTVAGSAWMPLAATILGAVAIGPFVRRPRRRSPDSAVPPASGDRRMDLCALCAVPAVVLQLLFSLLAALLGMHPTRWFAISVLSAGGAWFLVLLVLGVRLIRGHAEPAP